MAYLQPTRESSTGGIPVFQKVLETAQGGFSLVATGLTEGAIVKAGSVVAINEATRKATILKTATMQDAATNSATVYKVEKGHSIAVGDYLARAEGGAAYAVTDIDTSNADYDEITVGTTLGVAVSAGDGLFVSSATGASAAAIATGQGLLYEDTVVQTDAPVSVVIRGTVYARRIPGIIATQKAEMPNIIFSESY